MALQGFRRVFSAISLGTSLRARIVTGTILPVLAITLYFGSSYMSLRHLASMTETILNKRIEMMRSAELIKQCLLVYDDALFRYLALRDVLQLQEGNRMKNVIHGELKQLIDLNADPILDDRLDLLTQQADLFFTDAERLLDYARHFPVSIQEIKRRSHGWVREESSAEQMQFGFLSEEGRTRMVRVFSLCDEIITINRMELGRAQHEIEDVLRESRHKAIVLSLMATLILMLMGTGFALSMIYPLRDLLGGVRQMERGEPNVHIPVTSGDEIGELTEAFNRAAETIRQQREQLTREAITDSLTGAYNQRYFRKLLRQELERARRGEEPLSLLMIDVDYFKQINDSLGHEFGNDVLKKVVRLIRDQLREVDMLARYGGDEFAVILPNTSAEQAQALAVRLLESVLKIQRSTIPIASNAPKLTLSIGGASSPDQANHAEELVRLADEALYSAKQAGRGRAYWFGVGSALHVI